jgi:hypothetical protein
MKIKLNEQELEALYNYFERNIIQEIPDNDLERIAQELLCNIFLKMYKRLKTRFRKNNHLSLDVKECIAFRWHYTTWWVEEGWTYETIIARRLMAQIDPPIINSAQARFIQFAAVAEFRNFVEW